MYRTVFRLLGAAIGMVVVLSASAVDYPAGKVPVISKRTFVAGSAKLRVTGSFEIDSQVAINKPASIADDGMTWLQYGDSGSPAPNVAVTISTYEVGISVGLGKKTATAGAAECKGTMTVTPKLITGHYKCPGVASHEPPSLQLGTVDIEIEFSAQS